MGDEWQGRTLDMNAFGRQIAARKAALGLPDDSAHPELCRRGQRQQQPHLEQTRAAEGGRGVGWGVVRGGRKADGAASFGRR